MKKIKLAMVTPFSEKEGVVSGGVEGVAVSLVSHFVKIGELEIHIVAPCYQRGPGIEKRGDITIHWIRSSKIPGFLAYWSLFRQSVHKQLQSIQPDVTHFQGVAGWALGYRLPYVLTIHGLYEKDVMYEHRSFKRIRKSVIAFVEKSARRRSKNIILISPYVADEIGSQITGRTWNVENPVAADFFDIQRSVLAPQILYVGRISLRKNVKGLINAFSRIKELIPDANLRLAGNSGSHAFMSECKMLVKSLGLDQSVFFLGNINRDELKRELSGAACLALVSLQETAPMVIEEAMAAGVPVVASRLCGIRHMIDDGESGYLVDPENEQDVYSRLFKILNDMQLNKRFGEKGRRIATDRFHAEKVAMATWGIYQELLYQ